MFPSISLTNQQQQLRALASNVSALTAQETVLPTALLMLRQLDLLGTLRERRFQQFYCCLFCCCVYYYQRPFFREPLLCCSVQALPSNGCLCDNINANKYCIFIVTSKAFERKLRSLDCTFSFIKKLSNFVICCYLDLD